MSACRRREKFTLALLAEFLRGGNTIINTQQIFLTLPQNVLGVWLVLPETVESANALAFGKNRYNSVTQTCLQFFMGRIKYLKFY